MNFNLNILTIIFKIANGPKKKKYSRINKYNR